MKRKKTTSQLQQASVVLQGLLENGKSPLSIQFKRWKLWRNWEDVVGDGMAKVTAPVGFTNGLLYVWVKSSTHMQEVRFVEATLLKKVNEFMGGRVVRKIWFTLDRKSVPCLNDSGKEFKNFLSK